MSWNKISGLVNLPAAGLPIALPAGGSFMLPSGQGLVGTFGGVSAPQIGSGNTLTGQYLVTLGQYSTLQVYDSALMYWRNIQVVPGATVPISSDGTNFRIANTTGTPVGALLTNAGTGYTNGFYGYNAQGVAVVIQNGATTVGNTTFTITPSAGSSLWNAIVGGAVNTTISLSGTVFQNQPFGGTGTSQTAIGGTGYTRPPIIVFTPPPNQGAQPYILPTATCTISAGVVNAVTVTNQGAGLLGSPGITVVNQPGDVTGSGAILGWSSGNSADAASGKVLAMWCAYGGTGVTAVPTFTFSPASTTAATAIMNFTITSFTTGTPGVGYVGAGGAFFGGLTAGSAANTNPMYDKNVSGPPIFPPITVAATTGTPTLAGTFGGVNIQSVPTYAAYSAGAAASTAAVNTCNVGGVSDVCVLQSL